MKKSKVLVYGATGTQASPVVTQLLAHGHSPVVFTRHPKKAAAWAQQGATIFEGDIHQLADTTRASQGVDAIALHIPFFNPDPILSAQNAIQGAKAAGVPYIVWNTAGPILPHETGNPAVDVRRHTRDLLQQSGIAHLTLQPTTYAENLLGPWTAPFVQQEDKVAYPTPPDFKIGWLPAAQMAQLMVAGVANPAFAGQTFTVSGAEALDGPALAATFSAGLGRPIDYYPMPPQDFGAILDRVMGPGAGAAVAAEYQAIWDGKANPQMYVDMTETLATFGVEFPPLSSWVGQFAGAFAKG